MRTFCDCGMNAAVLTQVPILHHPDPGKISLEDVYDACRNPFEFFIKISRNQQLLIQYI
jgi:hypothetical protein